MKPIHESLPDERNWELIDANGIASTTDITHAKLPLSEVRAILGLVTYLNQQLDGCNALASKAAH